MSKIEVDTIAPQSGTTVTLGESGDTIAQASGTTISGLKSTGIDDNATSTAITIDSSENVGIGTSSPASTLEISKNDRDNGCTLSITNSHSSTSWEAGDIIGTINFRTDDTSTTEPIRGQVVVFDDGSGAGSAAPNDSAMKFSTASSNTLSERMRITSSGNVGIGTTSPSNSLEIAGSGTPININSTNDEVKKIQFENSGTAVGYIGSSSGTPFRLLNGSGTEHMRIDSSGALLVGKTALNVGTAGVQIENDGGTGITRDGSVPLYLNRNTDDGVIVVIRQSNTTEGTISVSGTTVSYNGFTGTHWSRFTDNSKPTILKGTVLETLDEMCDWYNLEFDVTTQDEDGNDITTTEKIPHVLTGTQSAGDTVTYNYEGTDYQATIVKEGDIKHMKSKVSDTVDAKNVYGVFVAYDDDGEGYNDFYVASVGSFVVRIKANETIAKGDLLQSNGDGTAKVQTDDAVRSSSFAKVLSTTKIETFDDGSYLVPCSLHC